VIATGGAPGLFALAAGAVAGAGVFLLVAAVRGVPATGRPRESRLRRWGRDIGPAWGAAAVFAGLLTLVATQWLVAGVGVTLLVVSWRGLSGAAGERTALARLEGLATWTESLRDTIAGAVGLEQAIPASQRAAAPSLHEPLGVLVDRLHTRVPMPDALRRFADDLGDPGADLIIAALIINSRLRGPGLRDLLGALSRSVREELDVRRKVYAERRSTRRSAQIVVGISVGLALGLGVFDRGYVHIYSTVTGQLVLAVVAALYAAGIAWMRSLARFDTPERLLVRQPEAFQLTPAAAEAWHAAARGGAT
jgi:Flp pilus assembly protein TadB